ncbi:MAG TPA: hypothetical protein VGA09_22835, partial [Candidatus Binatia bacterium]
MRGSVLAATLDECNLPLAGIALLIILIDVVGCEILIAAGLDVELSQVLSLFVAAILSVALAAGRFLPESARLGEMNRWTLFSALL